MGSVLLDNVVLEDWCFVGAATLLTPGKKFPTRSFILGSPGRRVREISDEEARWISLSAESYADLARRYRR
jgi:carbonic anhydrase/acetyltransferase-like protein (isoleucine patch superfamily)